MPDPHNNQPGQTMTTADDKARRALFAALAKAQSEMGSVFKDSTNPHFRSKYAGLPAVLNEIIPTLNRHDISFVQAPDFDADTGCVILRTALRHKDGAEIVETTRAPIGKKLDPQAFGSAVTYLRRYAAQSMLGISVEDDDGNAASGRMTVQRQAQADKAAQSWAGRIAGVLADAGLTVDDFDVWAESAGRKGLATMSPSQLQALHGWLEHKNGCAIIRKTLGGAQ
jgi:hypothetical protein